MLDFQLFHVADDPAEQNNVLDQYAEFASRLKSRLKRRLNERVASGRIRPVDSAAADDCRVAIWSLLRDWLSQI